MFSDILYIREIQLFHQHLILSACVCSLVKLKILLFCRVNPLPDDKILGLPNLQTTNVTENIEVAFHRIENIAGKEENAGYQHFLLFPQCFQKDFSFSASKVVIVW